MAAERLQAALPRSLQLAEAAPAKAFEPPQEPLAGRGTTPPSETSRVAEVLQAGRGFLALESAQCPVLWQSAAQAAVWAAPP